MICFSSCCWGLEQITAIFASGGDHTTKHAHWGYYMIAAVALQVFTGFMRTKGLEAKHANFSYLHRVSGCGCDLSVRKQKRATFTLRERSKDPRAPSSSLRVSIDLAHDGVPPLLHRPARDRHASPGRLWRSGAGSNLDVYLRLGYSTARNSGSPNTGLFGKMVASRSLRRRVVWYCIHARCRVTEH